MYFGCASVVGLGRKKDEVPSSAVLGESESLKVLLHARALSHRLGLSEN